MFSLVSGVYDAYFAPTELNLLVVGASGTGKTALLERLKVTQFTKKSKAPVEQPEPLDVPESFLPIALRVPDGQLKKQVSSHSVHRKKKKKDEAKTKKRRNFLACPAPSKYDKANDSSSEEDGEDDGIAEEEAVPDKPVQKRIGDAFMDTSLEDVPIGYSETSVVNGEDKNREEPSESPEDKPDDEEAEDQDYDLKAKARMLPLHKIRPTVGQNLGKVEMCGAMCRVWDVGGKMHDLWSRYFPDADAVVFVWKIIDDSSPTQQLEVPDRDSDDEDWPPVTAAQQLGLLETVRASIPDDVPFLIWGHWFPPMPTMKKPKEYQYDEPYSTGSLMPHYHNPLMTVYFGSAKTGAGVRTAMEWLIPTASRQKKFRDKISATADDSKA